MNTIDAVSKLMAEGYGKYRIAKQLGLTPGQVVTLMRKAREESKTAITDDPDMSWRDMLSTIKNMQSINKSVSKVQQSPDIHLDAKEPICVVPLADFHLGAYGTDYTMLQRITDELLQTRNLYTILIGDELDFTIKMRSIPEMFSGVLTPEQQVSFCTSWFHEIKHKVIASIAGNHDLRAYNQSGVNIHRHIFSKFVPYSAGIMHIRLHLGDIVYNIAGNHFFKGYSMYNKTHGHKRFSREKYPEGDIYIAGHTHQPAYMWEMEHGKEKLYLNTGTLKTNDEYAKMFYTLTTHPRFPCFVLYPDRKKIVPLPSVADFISLQGD